MAELPADDPRHGTPNGYSNLGCRCAACKEANRLNHAEYMARVRRTGQLVKVDDALHGTSYRYDVGCRCDACRKAHNAKSRAIKQRLRERRRSDSG